MVTKPKAPAKPNGRRKMPPDEVRSDRLVLRSHPDLMDALSLRAKVYGVSRSQLIERVLISYLNMQDDQRPLDMAGRYLTSEGQAKWMKMTVGERLWSRFGSKNKAVVGKMQLERRAADLRHEGQDIPEPDEDDGEGNTQ
jgi:hypothetical protein